MNFSNVAILKILKGSNYWCIIGGIRNSEITNLMQNTGLTEKIREL